MVPIPNTMAGVTEILCPHYMCSSMALEKEKVLMMIIQETRIGPLCLRVDRLSVATFSHGIGSVSSTFGMLDEIAYRTRKVHFEIDPILIPHSSFPHLVEVSRSYGSSRRLLGTPLADSDEANTVDMFCRL